MGVIEDVRKVIQDTVAPDLKALSVRVEQLEKRIEQRFQDQRDCLEKRFDSLERMLNQQQVINSLAERIRYLESNVRVSPAAHEEAKIERVG
jgi:hypothetical protein